MAAAKPKASPVKTPVKAKAIKFVVPKHLGACADLLYQLRADRLKVQRQADEIEAREKALKEHIIATLPKSQASGVSGKEANVKVEKKQVAQVKDWKKFYAHLKRTGDFDLLGKSLKQEAVRERWDHRKKVPGVEPFDVITVSCTKV